MMNGAKPLTALQRMLVVGSAAFLICSIVVLGSAVQDYAQMTMLRDQEVSFWSLAAWPAVWWFSWALLSPLFFEFAWRVRISRNNWARPVLILVAGMFAAFASHVVIQVLSMYLPRFSHIHPDLQDAVEYHVLISLYLNVLIYWSIVAGANVLRSYEGAQLRALRASELETELARARLDSLKMQLHPHFLFNTLNGISSLMYRDVELADRMVSSLSRLLRRALDRADVHELSLREEIDLLREYLAIERLRFGEGLEVRFEIEEGIDDALVPSFLYQPLVENSIKHAIGPQGNAGVIVIGGRTVNRQLKLCVSDNGPGLEPGEDLAFSGVGLANLYDRLDRLYGDQFALDLTESSLGGLTVEVTVPLRRSSRPNGTETADSRSVTESHP